MTTVEIKYNPYIVETEIKIDGAMVKAPNKLADLCDERLQVWVEDLVPILDEICNDDQYSINFYGTRLDYNDLESCVNDFCEENKDITATVNFEESRGAEDRYRELVNLFVDMQKNCPFEDLKTKQIKDNFLSAISSEFEVSVIATMSSGKSTLINALLGKELMPSKNEDCTATIGKIKDIDGMDHFEAVYRDKKGKKLGEFKELSLEDMIIINDDPETAYIDIKGDIPYVNSDGVQLVLVDTPGPNNTKTGEHRDYTYRIIKEKYKPMVLYVLNATQLATNDDKRLLSVVAEAMQAGGKQSKDRFIFAVNKLDMFDPDKESVQGALENVKEYLKGFGIEKPNIFPTSAEMAKVIRMNAAGYPLTSMQKRTLRNYDLFIDEEQFHLSDQATLSKSNMEEVHRRIEEAQAEGDEYTEALLQTGIPAIELAIDEYLVKYAYTTKIKAAVDTFKKKVEEKDMHSKMMASIQNDEAAREKINAKLKEIQQQLEAGAMGKEFKKRIQNLDMMEQADKRIRQLRRKVDRIANNRTQSEVMEKAQVTKMMDELDKRVKAIQSDVKTELEKIIDEIIVKGGNEIIRDYRQQMHSLISSGDLKANDFAVESRIRFLEESIPDAQQIINQYKHTIALDTGMREEYYEHRWWDIFELFDKVKKVRIKYLNKDIVETDKVYRDYIDPVMASFNKNLDNARMAAQREADKFKAYFLKELDSLEAVLKEKVKEDESLTQDQASVMQKLKEDQDKIEWLEDFMTKLDEILAI